MVDDEETEGEAEGFGKMPKGQQQLSKLEVRATPEGMDPQESLGSR